MTNKALRKEIMLAINPHRADQIEDANKARRGERAAILKLARELRRLLSAATTVPGGLRERLEQALTELEALD